MIKKLRRHEKKNGNDVINFWDSMERMIYVREIKMMCKDSF